MPTSTSPRPRTLGLTAGLFILTLGAYFPIWVARAAADLRRAGAAQEGITPRGAAALALVPVANIVGLAYLAIALPRGIRRVAARADSPREANTEIVSALMISAVAGGVALSVLIGIPPELGGYLAWPLELPAALLVQRHLNELARESPAVAAGARRRFDGETLAALAIAVVVLAGGGIALAVSGDDGESGSGHPGGAPAKPAILASDIAISPQAVWETRILKNQVQRLNLTTLKPAGPPIDVGRQPLDIAYGYGSIWVANRVSGTVTRIDPSSGRIVGRPIVVGRAPWGLAIGDGGVWVANQVERTAVRIDPVLGRVRGKPAAIGVGSRGIDVGEGAVWVANFDGRSVSRIDPAKRSSKEFSVEGSPQDVAAGYGAIWVTRPADNLVYVLSPHGRRLGAPLQVESLPNSIEAGLGAVWVANSGSGTVTRIDPRTRRIVPPPLRFGGQISDITISGNALWVLRADGSVKRVTVPRP